MFAMLSNVQPCGLRYGQPNVVMESWFLFFFLTLSHAGHLRGVVHARRHSICVLWFWAQRYSAFVLRYKYFLPSAIFAVGCYYNRQAGDTCMVDFRLLSFVITHCWMMLPFLINACSLVLCVQRRWILSTSASVRTWLFETFYITSPGTYFASVSRVCC